MGGFSKWRKLEEAYGRDLDYYANDTRTQEEIQGYSLGYDHPNVSREGFLNYLAQAKRNNGNLDGYTSPSLTAQERVDAWNEQNRRGGSQFIPTQITPHTNHDTESISEKDNTPKRGSANRGNKAPVLDDTLALESLMGYQNTVPSEQYGAAKRVTAYTGQLKRAQRAEGSSYNRRMDALEEEAARRQEWFDERAEKYAHIPQNADFEQNIDGWEDVGKVNDPLMSEAAQGYSRTVPLENQDADVKNAYAAQEYNSSTTLTRLSPTERKIYRYLQNTEGKEAAQDYMDYLSYRVNARDMNEVRAAAERGTETTGGKIGSSLLSVPANLVGGALGSADIMAQNVRNLFGEYRPVDYNSGGQMAGEYAQTVRESTQEDMGNVGRFVYGTAMSMADSVASMLTVGKAGGTLLGLSAARQGVQDAVDAGATESQAMAMGIFNGAAEMIFENVGIDNLYSILEGGGSATFKDAALSILGQALSEGTEEVATTLANTWGDAVIMADKSEINRTIQEYVAQGATLEEATRAAWLSWAMNLGVDFLGGAVSGTLFGTAGTIISNIQNNRAQREAIKRGEPFYQDDMTGGRKATLQQMIDEVVNNKETADVYDVDTYRLAREIERDGIENVKNSTLLKFIRAFATDRGVLTAGIISGEVTPDMTRDADFESDTVSVNSGKLLGDGTQDTNLVFDENGNVDVEQTLKNAAESSVQLETAREQAQSNSENSHPAWSDYLSMPQNNTSLADSAANLAAEYSGNSQLSASPVAEQSSATDTQVVAPTRDTQDEQSSPEAVSVAGTPKTASSATVKGETNKPVKVTSKWFTPFKKATRVVKTTYNGHAYVTNGFYAVVLDGNEHVSEQVATAEDSSKVSTILENIDRNATNDVSYGSFVKVNVGGNSFSAIDVGGKLYAYNSSLLSNFKDATLRMYTEGTGSALCAYDGNDNLVGLLMNVSIPAEKLKNAVALSNRHTEEMNRATSEYDENTRRIFKKWFEKDILPLDVYKEAFKSAYDAGKTGLDYKKFIEVGGKASILHPDARMAAYAAGQRAAMAEQNSAQSQRKVSHNSYIKDDGSAETREYLDSVDTDFLEWIEDDGKKQFYVIQKAPRKLESDIKRVLGVDVTGWDIIIEDRILNHILKDHGKSGKADHSMQFPEDIARMAYIIKNYDAIQEGKKSSSYKESGANGRVHPASTVQISKAIGDKTYVVYEAVPITKKKTIYIGSAFFAKKGDFADPGNTPGIMASEEASALVSASTVTEPPTSVKSTSQKLADTLHPLLQKGTAFNSSLLFELANKAFGGTQAEGAYSPKDAYDAMELAVNQYLLTFAEDFNGDAKQAVRAINKLQNLLDKLPTQTKRTAEMESFQQFSTPPTIAFLAAWTADITSADTVLEPSAGIGGLAVYPKAWGAQTVVNELSKRRLAVLENMGFDLMFNENAEQINNVLPSDMHPSVVLMNPPFSSTAGRTTKNKTSNAARHIEQALLRLSDGGRLVAILGRGMSDDAVSFRKWWSDIKGKYNVRANISIDGKNYRKYGTSFDVQLVVIDKTDPQDGETLTGTFTDLKEIPNVLEGIRNDRSEGILRDTGLGSEHGTSVHAPGDRRSGASVVGGSADASAVSADVDGGRTDGSLDGTVRGHNGNVAGSGGGSVSGVSQNSGHVGNGSRLGNAGLSGKRGDGNIRSTDIRSESEPALSGLNATGSLRDQKPVKVTAQKNTRGAVKDNGVFAQYVPAPLPVAGAKPHPAKLVESAAMSAVSMPKATYVPNLPTQLVTSGALSDAQLENVVYAGQAHEQVLPNGERRGYFIGDGTGVGKGRQIAAVIMDNMRQGRKKAVWISKNTSLFLDAQRDWADLGGDPSLFINNKKGDFPKTQKQWSRKDGILFLTYGGLSWSKGDRANIDAVANWLGSDFDGVIAFDEAHEMSNGMQTRGKFGAKKPSQKALTGIELQKRFPNARILYVSATGATEVSNLVYASRLGLWGKGTAFATASEFVDKIGASGLAAMELVARDMKSAGSYLARSISYEDVKYDTLEHKLTRSQRTIYDTMSEAWQVVLQNVNEALSVTGQQNNGRSRGAALSTFYNYLQNFYNQVLTSMAMPSVVSDIQRQLDDGKSVVIQIVNTNEAQQDRAMKKAQEDGLSLEEMDMTPRELLLQYLEKCFPTQVFEEHEDEHGNLVSKPAVDSQGNPIQDTQAVAMRDELIDRVRQMSVPDGALEILLNAFGTQNVAEVTGRSSRVVFKTNEDGTSTRVEERRSPSARDADATAFQNGEKRILVFSQAGGTGKSYHADLRAKNQQQRVHYMLQPGWIAASAIQGLGRTHRSNQASAPIVRLVTTDVKGHKRFISTIARRMSQLGALTKGQRDAGSGIFGEKDNLESPIAIRSLQAFYDALGTNQIAGLDGKTVLSNLGLANKFYDEFGNYKADRDTASDMGRFLNRILALKVDEQNRVFDAFMSIYDEAYDRAVADDTLDVGMETVKAESIDIIDDSVVRKDESTGAETHYVQANVKNKPRIISYKMLPALKDNYMGLYRSNSTGEVRAVYRIADRTNPRTGEVQHQYSLQTAVFGKTNVSVESRFKEKYTAIPKAEWPSAWKEAVSAAPEYNETTYHMITGTLLPIWGVLPQSERVKVKRLTADNGATYLGRIIEPSQIDSVLSRLGTAQRTHQTYSAPDVYRRIMNGDDARLLYNGWHLKRSRVSGEQRIEITGKNLFEAANIDGVFTERINYVHRYFIPTDEKKGIQVIETILKENPVSDISQSAASDVDYMKTRPSKNGSAQTTAQGDGKNTALSLSEIVERLKHDFGVNVTTGHVRGSGIAGTYSNTTNGIRSRLYNDLPTISHELGHHLDNRYGITTGISAFVARELVRCAGEQRRGSELETRREGLAEFIRLYLQNRETATIDFPNIESLVRSRVDENDLSLLNALSDEINAYYAASEKSAQSSIVSTEDGNADARTLGEKIADTSHNGYRQIVDTMHGLKLFSDRYGSGAYMRARNSAYSDAVAAEAISGAKLRDINGNVVGDSLRTVLKGVKISNRKEYAAFNEYLVVRHGPERLAENMRVFANDRQNSTQWMEHRREELEAQYPAFKEAAERLYKYQRNVLFAYGVQTGLISQATYDKWGERWQSYVPLNRQMEASRSGRGVKRGFANQTSTIKRAHGSGRNIINPIENIFSNTTKLIVAAMNNRVMQTAVQTAVENPDDMTANWLERVYDPLQVQRDTITPVKSQIAHAAVESFTSSDDIDTLEEILNEIDDILIEYKKAATSRDPRVVTVLIGGQKQFWRINDDLLFESLTSMQPQRVPPFLRTLVNVNRFITSNLTGSNLVWSVFSNMPRDFMTAMTYGKDKNPVHFVVNVLKSYANAVRSPEKQSETYQLFRAMGGGMDSIYSSSRTIGKDARRMITRKPETPWEWVKSPLDLTEFVSNMIEGGPRYAEFVARLNAGESPEEAILASHDVTVDFRRGGAATRGTLNGIVPFLNANIQGIDKLVRYISASDVPAGERKKIAALRSGIWLAASAIIGAVIFAVNHGSEEKERDYAMLSTYTKNNYFCIPTGDGMFLTIPKPREIAVPSSFTSAALEYAFNSNENALDDFGEYTIDMVAPPIADNLATAIWKLFTESPEAAGEEAGNALGDLGMLGVAHYLSANKDFLGRPIVSSSLENVEAKDQYTAKTSRLAYAIGQAFNMSPVKIDYALQNILGGWWKNQKALFPMDRSNVDLTLGVSSTWVRDSLYSTDILNAMYDNATEAKRASNSDPDNGEKAAWKAQYNRMTSFYSNFNSLARTTNGEQTRIARRSVLDMINDFNTAYENGTESPQMEAVFNIIRSTGDTSILPTTMKTELKYDGFGGEQTITLSPDAYLEYQTEYNALYWERAVVLATRYADHPETAVQKINEMKRDISERATKAALSRARKAN